MDLRDRDGIRDDVLHRLEFAFDMEALLIGRGQERVAAIAEN